MSLEDLLTQLDDQRAINLLQQFAKGQISKLPDTSECSRQIAEQMRTEFGVLSVVSEPLSEGALAREALLFLASTSEHREGVHYLVEHPSTERFSVVETALLFSAVLIALQTHVRVERDKSGAWTFKIEKKSTDLGLLKDIIQKLARLA